MNKIMIGLFAVFLVLGMTGIVAADGPKSDDSGWGDPTLSDGPKTDDGGWCDPTLSDGPKTDDGGWNDPKL